MNIKKIPEITSLSQLRELLNSCKATPASEVMPGGNFYKLRACDFRYPDGTIQRREYVDKRPASVVVPIDPNNKLIMVVQPTALVEEGALIEFPAGYAEPDEGGKATGIRELLEETGLRSDHISYLRRHYQDPGLIRQPVKVYMAEYCEQVQNPKPDRGEYIKLCKVDHAMLMEMLQSGYLADANTIIAAMKVHLRYFAAT